MAAAYAHRPPYADETFGILEGLLPEDAPRHLLDVGCGTGDLARPLVTRMARVDAVDASAAMIAAGKRRPGGEAAHLRWICAPMETAPLAGPYALAVAGESIHWMNWDLVFPRIRGALAPGTFFAIVRRFETNHAWNAELGTLIRRYSTNQDYVPFDLIPGLEARGWFRPRGAVCTDREPFIQSREAYIESIHSRNGFSRARMGVSANVFDAKVRDLLMRHGIEDEVRFETWSEITWGDV